MAYRSSGFDVANFISPFGGDPIGAQKLQASVWNNVAQDAQVVGRQIQAARQARAQQDLERQAITQRALAASQAEGGRNARAAAQLAQQRELARLKLEREQAAAGAGLVGDAAKAQAAGDANALAGIQARAALLDPMMRMTLPGQVQPRVDPNLPSVDEAYPLDPDELSIERGGKQLYGQRNADVQQREQDVIGRMIAPLAGSPFAKDYAPSFEAGMGLAGRGMTGAQAAELALKQGNVEADRASRIKNAQTMAGAQEHRQGIQDATLQLRIDDQIDQIQSQVNTQYGVTKNQASLDSLAKLQTDIASGVPFQQNKAMLELLKESIRGAGSDKDMAAMDNAAGFWNSFERNLARYADGGALPPEFQQQVTTALQAAQLAAERKKNRAGMALRDAIYNSPLLPLSDEQRVMVAHDRYSRLTGRQLPPEELKKELGRMQRARAGGLGGSPGMPSLPGAGDNLGVTSGRPPPIPISPGADDDDEADDLINALTGGE